MADVLCCMAEAKKILSSIFHQLKDRIERKKVFILKVTDKRKENPIALY